MNFICDANPFSVFHILDSLQDPIALIVEGKLLQKVLLKHFDGATYLENRIATRLAEVIFVIRLALGLFKTFIRCLSNKTTRIAPVLPSTLARSFF